LRNNTCTGTDTGTYAIPVPVRILKMFMFDTGTGYTLKLFITSTEYRYLDTGTWCLNFFYFLKVQQTGTSGAFLPINNRELKTQLPVPV
jgi:hypothetical protein